MFIGELAKRTGTTARALRFYEEQGLLASERTPSGYRTYPDDAVRRVGNIRELLGIGFTVEDVRAFQPYLDHHLPETFPFEPRCANGYAAVGAPRVAELNRRIEHLTRLRDTLVERMPWLLDEEAARGASSDSPPWRTGNPPRSRAPG